MYTIAILMSGRIGQNVILTSGAKIAGCGLREEEREREGGHLTMSA